ncbi:MAG: hypothetical protein U0X87_03130 [Anaerolineales bacterium]
MDGVPVILPALTQAQEYQRPAPRKAGWNQIDDVLDKVKEEIEEIKRAETDFELARRRSATCSLCWLIARWKQVDARSL